MTPMVRLAVARMRLQRASPSTNADPPKELMGYRAHRKAPAQMGPINFDGSSTCGNSSLVRIINRSILVHGTRSPDVADVVSPQ